MYASSEVNLAGQYGSIFHTSRNKREALATNPLPPQPLLDAGGTRAPGDRAAGSRAHGEWAPAPGVHGHWGHDGRRNAKPTTAIVASTRQIYNSAKRPDSPLPAMPGNSQWLLRIMAALVLLLAAASSVWAAETEDVKKRFQEHFQGVPVDNVTTTPYGLYEVQVGDTLVYTNAEVSWVLEGILIDTATRQNITAARQEQLNAVPFDQLPLNLAFEQTKGDGSRKIAIFEDPNCPYCKQFRRTLEGVDNLTIYTFLYPILSPDSRVKSESVWCASDKVAAWDAWMLENKVPAVAECEAPLNELIAAGQRLRVRGTPTVFFEDGTRASGALPAQVLEQRLSRAAR